MSSILDKLLKGQKVEWLPIEQVIKSLKTGLNPRKNFELNTPDAENFYVTVREIQNGKIVFIDKTDKVNDHGLKLINNRSNLEVGDILFSGTGTVGRTAVILEEPKNWNIKEGVYVIKPEQNKVTSKFLAYLLNSNHIIKIYEKKIVGSPVISLPMAELKKIIVPIPPLDVQAEIVRILDAFTELTAELTAELTMREKQYHYYRDSLLTFSDDVEWVNLGNLAKIVDGTHSTPKYTSTGIPFVSVENIKDLKNTKKFISQDDFNKYKFKPMIDDIFMTRIGNIGTCTVVEDNEPLAYYVTLALIRVEKNIVLPRYVKFFIESSFGKSELYKRTLINAVPIKINLGDISKIKLPLPPLAQQQRIINILEKFETLTNSITEGLPKEIALRQQQYEYYREQLLDFPKS